MKIKKLFCAVFIAAMLSVMMSAAMAGTDEAMNDWMREWCPKAVKAFRPVNLDCTDQGIRMEVVSAGFKKANELYVIYSLEDTEGDRISEMTDAIFEVDYADNCSWEGYIANALADSESNQVFFGECYKFNFSKKPRDQELTVSMRQFYPSRETAVDLLPIYRQYGSQAEAVSAPANAANYCNYDPTVKNSLPDSLRVLSNNVPEIPIADHVTLSGIGIVDGFLHVQLHLTDCGTSYIDGCYYRPVFARCELYDIDDENTFEKYTDTARMIGGIDTIAWGSQPDDIYMPEYLEFVFTVDSELTDAQVFTANIINVDPPVLGDWEVTIPLKMIQKAKK